MKAESKKILVYVAGPYSSDNVLGVAHNIRVGRAASLELMKRGFAVYCPWNDWELAVLADLPMETWKENGLDMVRRCDAVYLVENWHKSPGTIAEIREVCNHKLPVFDDPDLLECWREDRSTYRTPVPIWPYIQDLLIGSDGYPHPTSPFLVRTHPRTDRFVQAWKNIYGDSRQVPGTDTSKFRQPGVSTISTLIPQAPWCCSNPECRYSCWDPEMLFHADGGGSPLCPKCGCVMVSEGM